MVFDIPSQQMFGGNIIAVYACPWQLSNEESKKFYLFKVRCEVHISLMRMTFLDWFVMKCFLLQVCLSTDQNYIMNKGQFFLHKSINYLSRSQCDLKGHNVTFSSDQRSCYIICLSVCWSWNQNQSWTGSNVVVARQVF